LFSVGGLAGAPAAWGAEPASGVVSRYLTSQTRLRALAIDRTVMVYLLDELEEQGLADAAEALLTPLDPAERRQLVDLLTRIADHWQELSANRP
jgi:hypothetical protein